MSQGRWTWPRNIGPFWSRTSVGLIGQALNLLLGVAASIPVARGLGVAGKGELAFYGWAVGLAVVLLGWGLHGAVATITSVDAQAGIAAARSSRRRLLPTISILMLMALVCFLGSRAGWGWACLTAGALLWGQPASGALAGSGRIHALYAGILAQASVQLVGLLVAFWSVMLTPPLAMAVSALAGLTGATVHSTLAGVGFLPHDDESPELVTLSHNGWLAEVATFLNYRLDLLIVRHLTGTEGLGLYTTGTAVAELGRTVPNAIAHAALKELGQVPEGERGRVSRRVARNGFLMSLAALTLLAFTAPWLITRLFGPAFAPAASVVAWLVPGIAALAVASVSASWLAVSSRSHLTARLAWYGTVASTGLSIALTSGLGLTGAAMASSLGYVLLACMAWRAAARGDDRNGAD